MKESNRAFDASDPKAGMTATELLEVAQEIARFADGSEVYPTAVIKIGSGRIKRIEVKR